MSEKFLSVRNKTAILFTFDTYNSATLFKTDTYMGGTVYICVNSENVVRVLYSYMC